MASTFVPLRKPCYSDPREFPAPSHSYHHLGNRVATHSQARTQDWLSQTSVSSPCAQLTPKLAIILMTHPSLNALKCGLLNCTSYSLHFQSTI